MKWFLIRPMWSTPATPSGGDQDQAAGGIEWAGREKVLYLKYRFTFQQRRVVGCGILFKT